MIPPLVRYWAWLHAMGLGRRPHTAWHAWS
eukprot:COSAG03_NODE_24709_length_270_cov_0.912281_1_plen_29_part_10